MHLSKNVLFIGIIGYCASLLLMQDWPTMIATTGTLSLFWLGKMFADLALAGVAAIRLVGPTLFAADEADDEVAIHPEDLAVSDTALYGGFLTYLVANTVYHAYLTVSLDGALSFYWSIWTMVEAVAILFTWILFRHAQQVQARLARTSRVQAMNQTNKAA